MYQPSEWQIKGFLRAEGAQVTLWEQIPPRAVKNCSWNSVKARICSSVYCWFWGTRISLSSSSSRRWMTAIHLPLNSLNGSKTPNRGSWGDLFRKWHFCLQKLVYLSFREKRGISPRTRESFFLPIWQLNKLSANSAKSPKDARCSTRRETTDSRDQISYNWV